MQKDMIFFGTEGLTSTSANHICNIAKEYYEQVERSLDTMQFYSTTVSIIGSSSNNKIEQGIDSITLNTIPSYLLDIAQCKSLIAWLREAIKARENLRRELNNITLNEWCEKNNIETPTAPMKDPVLTEDEYWGSKSIKERNAYYELETKASTLGKFIHPNGHFSNEREDAIKKSKANCRVVGTGRDSTIYNYSLTTSLDDINDVYFSLQNRYRDYQASLNSLKFGCQKAIEQSETEANTKHSKDTMEYYSKVNTLTAQMVQWKKEEDIKIGNYKIIIPQSLNDIYEKINKLGK